MRHAHVIAMNVTDEDGYARYRAGMKPILAEYGGGFRCDFQVAETLASDLPHPVTRVFVIFFRDRAAGEAFFQDPRYLAVRAQHFEGAVKGFTLLAATDAP